MEDEIVSDPSFSISRSESKSMDGGKRRSAGFGEKSELGHKRVKKLHLESVLRSEENIEGSCHFSSFEHEKSQVSKDIATANSDVSQGKVMAVDTLSSLLDPANVPLDLSAGATNPSAADTTACENKFPTFGKHDIGKHVHVATSRGSGWDVNAEDVSTLSSSLNKDPFFPYKSYELLKSGDSSECGSSTGPLEEKDPMRVWREMKQNGFMSSSHGGIPVPKPRGRGRRSKIDVPKKKMELAKREQVDRFAKIAAPSGLLNELNPGIINHVRNSKQVLSIIENIVKSGKQEKRHVGCRQAIPTNSDANENTDKNKDLEDGSLSTYLGSQQERGCPMLLSGSVYTHSDQGGGNGESSKSDRRIFCKNADLSPSNQDSGSDRLPPKLASCTTMASENTSSLSNEESANLSVKAANVASQWLEFLYQDIKGRLAALQTSKKRVRAVIDTELPFLISHEFSSNQENNPYAVKISSAGYSDNANANVHQAMWSALFHQMDKDLSEEEKQLENSLNQVKEMHFHCERGLQHLHCNKLQGSQQLETSEKDFRIEEADNSERELAIRAAAASIYSTYNFVLSMENPPCC